MKDLNNRVEQWRWAKLTREFLDAVEADAVAKGEAVGSGTPLGGWLTWARERASTVHEAAIAHRSDSSGPSFSAEISRAPSQDFSSSR